VFGGTPVVPALPLDVMTSKRYCESMTTPRRATVYLDEALHRALRLKAAETDRSVSDLVNEAVRLNLAEDAEDLAAYRTRSNEPTVPLEKVLKDLRRRGQL